MATIVLGAIGGSLGSGLGGSVLGVSSAAIGQAIGATLGQAIDQRYMMQGAGPVEVGKTDRFRINGASEGAVLPKIVGRMRIGGQVIWSTPFRESKNTESRGGKGGGGVDVSSYSYSVSLALALCEGEIAGISRLWADGVEVNPDAFEMRLYKGSQSQQPDALIEAIEGHAPSYNGTAYVVFEDLPLGDFGNRVPQFSFEVVRHAQPKGEAPISPYPQVSAVAMIPGTGEYAYATQVVHVEGEGGTVKAANVHTPSETADFTRAVQNLKAEMSGVRRVSLVSSWFGDDLRCDRCTIRPKVEHHLSEGRQMPWQVAGLSRKQAREVSKIEDRPAFGGTPTDQSVIQSLRYLKEQGLGAVMYPFLLMDIPQDNTLAHPYGAERQPKYPWRGRITTARAFDQEGTTQKTAQAADEVAAFFGSVRASDFTILDDTVRFTGPSEDWGYHRFILHHAALCAAAGGVEAFCIGSEMRALTQIMAENDRFPAVEELMILAREVRALLPDAKIGYASDWSEYFGYHPQDGSDDVYFHLDPLWAAPEIDFIGIDNYMPLSDWRDTQTHLDAEALLPDRHYFEQNVAGGEGYDWFYESFEARKAQRRTEITADPYGEDWIFRYKDLKGWWSHEHFNRKAGVQILEKTPWVPQSKPIWFTEYGCPAVDKGAAQPNLFFDLNSSEAGLPHFSNGTRDDVEQAEYLAATHAFWTQADNNPASQLYEGKMVDTEHCFAWTWDGRPWPSFPDAQETWSDGPNHARGHWLTGRSGFQPLGAVVAEICETAGFTHYDVSALRGMVQGMSFGALQTARSDLQSLMLAFGFEAFESAGVLHFRMSRLAPTYDLQSTALAVGEAGALGLSQNRTNGLDAPARLRVSFLDPDGSYQLRVTEAQAPQTGGMSVGRSVDQLDLPLVMPLSEARHVAERLVALAGLGADTYRLSVPPSAAHLRVGDVLRVNEKSIKITNLTDQGIIELEGMAFDPSAYVPSGRVERERKGQAYQGSVPPQVIALDLPLLDESLPLDQALVAVSATPWPSAMQIVREKQDGSVQVAARMEQPAIIGTTLTTLTQANPAVIQKGQWLDVKLARGSLSSVTHKALLSGANLMAIGSEQGDWELFQFEKAELVAPNCYRLRGLIRGQKGTEVHMPALWEIGSRVVLIDQRLALVPLSSELRGQEVSLLAGAVHLPLSHAAVTDVEHIHRGLAARPMAPVHLKVFQEEDTLSLSWIRRTRLGGDTWEKEVPLSEQREAYTVRFLDTAGHLLKHIETNEPSLQVANDAPFLSRAVAFEVAQISDSFGAGVFARRSLFKG